MSFFRYVRVNFGLPALDAAFHRIHYEGIDILTDLLLDKVQNLPKQAV
jgi:hypothetical protein